jgi:hypothetical protein
MSDDSLRIPLLGSSFSKLQSRIILLVGEQPLFRYLISHYFYFLAVRHINSKHKRKSLLRVLVYYSDERVLLRWNQNINRGFER